MRLPKRVPWSSLAEFEQVCSWIFHDENDVQSQTRALHRLVVWQATTALPHALESTMSLLAVILQDKVSSSSSTSNLSIRQSYGSAIIRLVNGFVDPLQSGVYARSIASIAQQIGLPSWFVEVRHAATHEDLPSLELLREAARQSMNWLLHNYFVPTLTPSEVSPSDTPALRDVSPILMQSKTLLKATTRDTSLKSSYKGEIASSFRELERWISEAKVDPRLAFASTVQGNEGDYDSKERWALEQLCDALLKPGVFVPLSKKKRILSSDSYFPPKASLAIWTPLIDHIRKFHPTFLPAFCSYAVSILLSPAEMDEGLEDTSYVNTIVRWVYWGVTIFEQTDAALMVEPIDLRHDLCFQLLSHSTPGHSAQGSAAKARTALVQALGDGKEALGNLLELSTRLPSSSEWTNESLDLMQDRLESTFIDLNSSAHDESEKHTPKKGLQPLVMLAPGIFVASDDHWKPCPIGIHHSISLPINPVSQ